MLALAHPLQPLLCPCSSPGPAASSGLFLRPLPTSPLSVIPVNHLNFSRDTYLPQEPRLLSDDAGAVLTLSPFADILTGLNSIRPKPCL
ncbi:hypothetical protein BDP55DRAFT_730601 [Colletotrichum godetiae]|uniref:Uncharacterized protein n=1 Tax=Colletotrichum godetiae TaxID=1209918 RepID=A0AAJ0ER25_9PEZI|nr:uncharacterized protein BDP55DRAFT_730601 [Colletotrichum godetiae]KAK1673476.1 hypothetical protein BDP55DRAFT_730601 [Colletotrichum godetiae]